MKFKPILLCLLSLSMLLGLLFVLPTFTVSAGDNLAVNGDLELGNTNGWEIDDASIDNGVKYAGNYSLKLTATSAYYGAAYKVVPVGKGATVTVSFYYRYASAPGSKLYHVYTYMGSNAYVGAYSGADSSLSASTAWKQVSYTFNSGDYASIYLKFCPGYNGGAVCYIDNLVVTATGGAETAADPYLTSFGTKYNRPDTADSNVIANGGFESVAGSQWNTSSFLKGDVEVVEDSTAPEGNNSLYFNGGNTAAAVWYTFPVTVEKNTQYTFSAWVKSSRLSSTNRATATFGVANAQTGEFLVYEPYNGNGNGSASLSTTTMQLMTTAPDEEWHLRSVTFFSGTHTTVNVAVYGAMSRLWLDDMALFKSAHGIEYISELRTATITATTNTGNRYCVDEDSLIPAPHMTGKAAENHWSNNPAWRNGFLSFAETGDSHNYALKYTASADTMRKLWYIDWIDVEPNTEYTLTMDVKRLSSGGGRIVLLDDNVLAPAEFYSVAFSSVDSDWKTYSITFNTDVYSRIGFAIVDGGGSAYIDKTRLFKTSQGIATEPEDALTPSLKPVGGKTSVMEMSKYVPAVTVSNGDFEKGSLSGWDGYQSTGISATAAYNGGYGAHLKGDGSWGAMLEQTGVPVCDGGTYSLSFWYKSNSSGANISLFGATTGTQYAYAWAGSNVWTQVTATFLVNGDTALIFNACGGGNGVAEDVYLDEVVLVRTDVGPDLGVAFLMELEAVGATRNEKYVGDLSNTTVDVYGDGTRYSLKEMGALMTNDPAVGTNPTVFKRENVSIHTADVPAIKLYDITDTTVTYAVRIIDIPYKHKDSLIYARPYYVFEKDGEEILVYGSIYSRSYDG